MKGNNKLASKIEEIIRVDHAGEYGAKRIYLGQLSVLKDNKKIKEMYEQELEHLEYFENEMKRRQVRPTALSPIWHFGGFALGAATAFLGEKAAMACTVAVESVISQHYQEQLDSLQDIKNEDALREKIKKFRNDEIEHHDAGIEYGAEQAVGYGILTGIVKGITKAAISISKRV